MLYFPHQTTEVRLYVSDQPQGIDLIPEFWLGYNPFLSAVITGDLAQPVVRADIRLHLGAGSTNLSPYISAGPWVSGRPLFDPGRYILLATRTYSLSPTAPAPVTIPFRPVFAGRIDAADPVSDPTDALSLSCRDVFCDPLDQWIQPQLTPTLTGGMLIDRLLPALLAISDANAGITSSPPGVANLEVAIVPSFSGMPLLYIQPYDLQPGSTLLAMREAGLQNGWDLRGRWGTSATGNWDAYTLTYYEPDRLLAGGPSSLSLGQSQYDGLGALSKSRDEVRNIVSITPTDSPRVPIIIQNDLSIAKYGPRFLAVVEDVTSHIATPTQALALATAILSDLKEPKVMADVETSYLPFVEINDLIKLQANQVHHDTDLVLAVSGFVHTLAEDGHASTRLHTRDIPAAANAEWRAGTPKTQYVSHLIPSGIAVPGARWHQVNPYI